MLEEPRRPVRLSGRGAGDDLTIINARFVADLSTHGYGGATIKTYGQVVEQFRCWLGNQRVQVGRAWEEAVARFVRAYASRCRRRQWPAYRVQIGRRALQGWLHFLRRQGWVGPLPHPCPTARERLLQAYDRHLAEVRGLAVGTRVNRQYQASRFLTWLSRKPHLTLQQLGPKEVLGYGAECAHEFPAMTARSMASGLRSFLRFLGGTRTCRPFLDQALPPLAPWPRGDLPRGLSPSEYRRFLASFDRTTPLGRRNYALALCLGELGLRASEAAAIALQDVDWRRQVLRLPQTKQRHERQLPLPPPVARALSQYLQRGRPASSCRMLFVRHCPPRDQGLSRSHVGIVMSRAFVRMGLSARGAHILRYTLATRLQQRGVGLKSIADLLGHQCLESTARYARVHLEALRQAALPWPEVRR